MAVVDDLAPGMDASPPNEEFGRQPPQDLAAEQSVLGGMLLSKDAIADVLERLRPGAPERLRRDPGSLRAR
jgi:replicative DNA helicase